MYRLSNDIPTSERRCQAMDYDSQVQAGWIGPHSSVGRIDLATEKVDDKGRTPQRNMGMHSTLAHFRSYSEFISRDWLDLRYFSVLIHEQSMFIRV